MKQIIFAVLVIIANTMLLNAQTSAFSYKIFHGKGGPKLDTAKFVKFNIEYSINKNGKDSILNSSFGKAPVFSAIDTSATLAGSPFMKILPKCRVGDSLVFSVSIDTLRSLKANLPMNIFPKGSFIKGKLKVLSAYGTREGVMADVKKAEAMQQAKESKLVADYLAKNHLTGQKTKSGAYVVIEQPGTGVKADSGKTAMVKYKGYLMDGGTVFDTNMDSSKGHTDPIAVTVGTHRVIPGWEEGLPYFGKGGKGKLFIPSSLGYGARGQGQIPPNANLIFDIEIVDVK